LAIGIYTPTKFPALPGTGNWPFNTAFLWRFQWDEKLCGRFDDLSEVEDRITAGIPVILSAHFESTY
jgi:hypothetical protein